MCSVSLAEQENTYLFVICEGVAAGPSSHSQRVRVGEEEREAVERMEEDKRSESGVQKEAGRERG